MSTFIGEFEAKADIKGRIVLPMTFKRELEAMGELRIVAKKDLYEQCLQLYPFKEWEKILDDLRGKLNPYNRTHLQFLREYQRNTAEMQLDANGRILIPKRLMASIGADKDVTFLGIDKHIELWDTTTFASTAIDNQELSDLANELLGGTTKTEDERE